jgi:hypothetical protein
VPETEAITDPPRRTRYPTTPTLSVDGVQASPTCDAVTLVAVRVPGGVGGVVSAWVVTGSVLLGWETLPAASDAVTW